MSAIRCPLCGKKLAEGHYASVLIKCPRCRKLTQFTSAHFPYVERHRTPVIPYRIDDERPQLRYKPR